MSENATVSTKPKDSEFKFLGLFDQKDFVTYIGGAVYGYLENMRAMRFDSPGVVDNHLPGEFVRASDGIQKLFDQNTGDGTIVALGFLGAEALSLSIDKIAKKLGKKGFDPKIRFLSSLAFGVGLASYLETTTIMNNTVDIPGDLFGVGLGAAFILTSRLAAEHINEENLSKISDKTKKFIESVPTRFGEFSKTITAKLIGVNSKEDNSSTADAITDRFIELVDGVRDDDVDLSV